MGSNRLRRRLVYGRTGYLLSINDSNVKRLSRARYDPAGIVRLLGDVRSTAKVPLFVC